jgi:ParB family transcriptional regulator, chromosome partitioning protein
MAALRAASRTREPDRFDEAAARMVTASERANSVQMVPLAQIRPDPDQPRRTFAEEALEELAASIREVGVLQPILVRRVQDGYQIVAGERRWRATQRAGLEHIPALIQTMDDTAALEASLTENLQRENLTPLEEAQIFRRMTTELGYSVRKLAERLGKGKGYIESRLRLARMPEDLQTLVGERPDTLTHAREIEQVDDAALRQELITETQAGAPLQEIRRRIQEAQEPPATPPPAKVSGRPDTLTRSATPGTTETVVTGFPAHPVVDAARRLHRAIEGMVPTEDPALQAALREELSLTATAIADLLARLDTGAEGS